MPGALPLWLPPRAADACCAVPVREARAAAKGRLRAEPVCLRGGGVGEGAACGAAVRQAGRSFTNGAACGSFRLVMMGKYRCNPRGLAPFASGAAAGIPHCIPGAAACADRSPFLRIYWPLGPFLLCHAHASFPDVVFGPGAARLFGLHSGVCRHLRGLFFHTIRPAHPFRSAMPPYLHSRGQYDVPGGWCFSHLTQRRNTQSRAAAQIRRGHIGRMQPAPAFASRVRPDLYVAAHGGKPFRTGKAVFKNSICHGGKPSLFKNAAASNGAASVASAG